MSRSPTPSAHQFHRHPGLPWAELRVSRESPHCYRLHMHAEYSIGIVDAGQAQFQHGRGPEPVTPGSVVLIEPGFWHACNPQRVSHWSYRMLYVQTQWLHRQLAVTGLQFNARALHGPEVTAAANLLCQPLAPAASPDDIASYQQSLLQFIQQHSTPVAAPERITGHASSHVLSHAVTTALTQLHQHPEDAPSIQSLAEDAGLSASRFIRAFKSATGVTPGAYRLNLRLNGARRLLAEGAALSDAAHHMGFADQAHLQRSFKAHHALTPGCYAHSAVA